MAVLSFSNAHLAFGHVALLDNAAFSLDAGERLGHAFTDGFEHAVTGLEHRFLRHVADAHALRHLQQAVVELFEAGDDLQHRRLAGAVAADQPEAFAGFKREGSTIEQGHMAIGEVGVGEGKDSHGVTSDRGAQRAASGKPRIIPATQLSSAASSASMNIAATSKPLCAVIS